MSAEEEKIRQGLKNLHKKNERVFNGIVTSVDEVKCTIDINTADGGEFYNVKLKALENIKRGFLIIPKTNSSVQVCEIGVDDFIMISADEVEKLILIIDSVKYEIDKNGVELKKGNDSLKDVVDDLFGQVQALNEELQKVVVVIGVTPNVGALQGINTQLQQNRNKAKNIFK